MDTNLNIIKIMAVILAYCRIVCSGNQPSYQVSINLQLHSRDRPIHLCNGVIVQSRLVLTTASCLHHKLLYSNNSVVAIAPSTITIISGTTTAVTNELTLSVSDIFVAEDFNFITGENDLALLRLNGIMPLDTRNDMSWITLADDDDYNGSCFANFYVRNSINGAPNYIQTKHLPLLNASTCVVLKYPSARENDICSYYYAPKGLNCNIIETLQNYNGDRGTGLVCENKLLGLLSSILPLTNATDCTKNPLKAYYTAVVPHLAWIFNVITEEDLNMLNMGQYISSSPYVRETNAFVKPELTESETSTSFIDLVNLPFQTESSAQKYNAAMNNNIHFQFSCLIFGFCFIVLTA